MLHFSIFMLIYKKMGKKFLLTLVLSFVLTNPLKVKAVEFIPMGHLEVLRAYSQIRHGSHLLGEDISGYYSPIVKFNSTLYLIPLYTIQFQKVKQFLPEEEGNHLYNTYMVHNFTLSLRKEFQPGWFVKFSAIGTWNFVKETHEEAWGRGLYDYRDAGAGIDLRHKKTVEDNKQDYTFGFQYYRRQYPNFSSLISLASPVPPERREKDFDGFKISTGFENLASGGEEFYIKPYFLIKHFIDKHLLKDDGTLNLNQHRQDEVFNLDCGFKLPLMERLFFYLDNNYAYNYSNAGFYDSRNTVILADDVFTPHYYSYHSYAISPALEYIYTLAEQKDVKVKLGYSFLDRYYTDRKSQTESGTYSNKEERDSEHCVSSSLAWPLTKKIDFLTKFSYTWSRSSQKYEQYYIYHYNIYEVEAGLSLDF